MTPAERRGRRPSALTVVALLVALVAALLPLTRVIAIGPWVAGALALMVLVLAAGYVVRVLRLPAAVATVVELVVWFVFTMVVFLSGTAIGGVVPTVATVDAVLASMRGAAQEIAAGSAPLPPSTALSLCIVGGFGMLAIVLDHVVVTTRMPLLASVALVAVWLIPSIVVPTRFDVVAFVVLAVGILLLLRADTRRRDGSPRRGPAGAVALGIGAVATVTALVLTPLLPTPPPRADLAGASALAITADLDLGRDLRQPRSTQVLTLRSSDAPRMPYLRIATLSTLDGDVWRPDAGPSAPAGDDASFGPMGVDPDVEVTEATTTITVGGLSSPWLPVPYAAVDVRGLAGSWTTAAENRTLTGDGVTAAGQDYTVVSQEAQPTLEQIRARPASGSPDDGRYTSLPATLPAGLVDLAREETADTANDYDALRALQRWFRGSDFTYSLQTPVTAGFDGSGVEAVGRFLEVRRGYCVHFASAFALMARSLGMPTRIVVGYLPGTSTNTTIDDDRVYAVSSSQLHAWPEVYFRGIGWVGFEPTKGLGTPTSFASSAGTTPDGGTAAPDAREDAAAEEAATPAPSASAAGPSDAANAAGPAAALGGALPLGGIGIVVLLALAAPSVAGAIRRRGLRTAAASGSTPAAWTLVQDAAIDVGILVPAAESPRAFGARLTATPGMDQSALHALVAAVERDAYATPSASAPSAEPPAAARLPSAHSLAAEAVSVRAALLASTPAWRRILALAFPRSLVVRPGSAFTASGRTARTG